LSDAIEKAHHTLPCAIEMEESPERVRYENVTLFTADKSRLLIDDLTVEIQRGARWLVTGPDDAPKLALFRATAGVWDCGAGKIIRPGLEDILFLPERPYLPPGPLRDALVRTGMEANSKDSAVHAVLHRLGLHQVVERVGGLSAEQDWDDVFSIGEQHLLSIARIFLAHPAFVFLDRPGSSLSKSQISTVLEMLSEHGIGVVILAKNGESGLHYHACLEIKADGRWEILREPGSDEHGANADLRDLSC
jgi:putative ATP-binding cassette transporter